MRPFPCREPTELTTRTLSRGLSILETLAAADELGLGPSAIAAAVALDKATVTRLLRTLIETGYATQDPESRRYRLTGKILRLAHGVARSLDLQRVARPHLKALRDRLGETVHLGVMEDLAVYYVDKLERRQQHPARHRGRAHHAPALDRPGQGDARGPARRRARSEVPADGLCPADGADDLRPGRIPGRDPPDAGPRRTRSTTARTSRTVRASPRPSSRPAAGPSAPLSVSGPHFRFHDHLDEFGEQVRATAAQIALGARLRCGPSPGPTAVRVRRGRPVLRRMTERGAFAGVFAPICTPFARNEDVDYAGAPPQPCALRDERDPRLPRAGFERREPEPHRARAAAGARRGRPGQGPRPGRDGGRRLRRRARERALPGGRRRPSAPTSGSSCRRATSGSR